MTTLDVPAHLCEMLLVRHYFALDVATDVPAALGCERVVVADPDVDQGTLTRRWAATWHSGLSFRPHDAGLGNSPPSWRVEVPEAPLPADLRRSWVNEQRSAPAERIASMTIHRRLAEVLGGHDTGWDFVVRPVGGMWSQHLGPQRWAVSGEAIGDATAMSRITRRPGPSSSQPAPEEGQT